METSSILSPLLFGPVPHYDALRRYSNPPTEPAEMVLVPTSPPEPNFMIDDLLDFSNGELCEELPEESSWSGEVEEAEIASGVEKEAENELKFARSGGGTGQEVGQQAETSGLCVPSDELADELEWLSAFNEDSSYSGDRHLASLVSSGTLGGSKDDDDNLRLHETCKFQSPSPISVLEPSGFFSVNGYLAGPSSRQPVPSRARSKRARTGARIWSLDSLMPTLFDTTRLAQDSPVFFGSSPPSREPCNLLPSAKKVKKQAMAFKPQVEAPIRRCSHCLVQKTPQWRAGPLGPKTLCNACGVRYKSGRLVPEYRPAGSPTFVSEVHSNSHKKILEMRRMKEMEEYVCSPLKDSCTSSHKEEDGCEDSDCFSQSESCKEDDSMTGKRSHLSIRKCRSQEDPNGSICSENEDVACSIRREDDDSAGSVKSN